MTATHGAIDARRASSARWAVLAAYALLAACTQLLWLTFAAIDTRSARVMHVDVGLVGDLAAVFPFVYIVLALPTGRWLDRAFAQALGTGAVLTGAGALLRVFAPESFAWQMAGQLVIAAGQPLVLNSINKVAARHFAPQERATAISIGTAALFVGILAAVLMAGPVFDSGGLALLLGIQAGVSILAAVVVLYALRTRPAFPDDPSAAVSLRWLVKDRFMWTLAVLVFIGMGTYNAFATWLQAILDRFGEGGAAGNLIAVLTFAGVLGAAVIPTTAARTGRRRLALLIALGVTAAAFAAVAGVHNVIWMGAWLFAAGFVLLAALPVVLDWSELHAGAERQGAAVGFLLMAGNLGGLLLVLVVQAVIGNSYLALGALAFIAVLGLPVVLRLPARYPKT
ncbi:MAG TPA: MFS transporter [Candidatus Dormibacteraeota bacterium]|nr:MFS transporter [Candidatus Dormibacteraeota bacterium]